MSHHSQYANAFAYGDPSSSSSASPQQHGHASSHLQGTGQGHQTSRYPPHPATHSHPQDDPYRQQSALERSSHNGPSPRNQSQRYADAQGSMPPPPPSYNNYSGFYDYQDPYVSPPHQAYGSDPSPPIFTYDGYSTQASSSLNPPPFVLDRYGRVSSGPPAPDVGQAGPGLGAGPGPAWSSGRIPSGGAGHGGVTSSGVSATHRSGGPAIYDAAARTRAGTPSDRGSVKGKGKQVAAPKEDARIGSSKQSVGTMGPPVSGGVKRDMLLLQGYLNEIITLLPPFCPAPGSAADTPSSNPDPANPSPSRLGAAGTSSVEGAGNPSGRRPPPEKPPKYLLARFARLSSQIKSVLLTLAPHVSLAPEFNPIPKRTERKMTRAEEEMDSIRRRRDALLAKAREQNANGGGVNAITAAAAVMANSGLPLAAALGQGQSVVHGQGAGRRSVVGSVVGSRSGSRGGSAASTPFVGSGRASAPPVPSQAVGTPDFSRVLAGEALDLGDLRSGTVPPPQGEDGHGRHESNTIYAPGPSDWPLAMREYMPSPGGYNLGMGVVAMDDGLSFADRLPDLDFTGGGPDGYGQLPPLSISMMGTEPRIGDMHSQSNSHTNSAVDGPILPPFGFPLGPGPGSVSALTHGSGSIASDPPSAAALHVNGGNNAFELGNMGDLGYPQTPTDFGAQAQAQAQAQAHLQAQVQGMGDLSGIQSRENIAWLARTTQPPEPSMQSQTNGMMDRCHGCGVVTGEWMVGPDGPGSLCVSCGLHYAKLAKRRTTAEMVQSQQPTTHSLSV